jgi:membrane protease YdiL (CAAX protease family)
MTYLSPPEFRPVFDLLAFMLVALPPIAGGYVVSKFGSEASPHARQTAYKIAIAGLLIGSLSVVLLIPASTFFKVSIQNRGASWLPSRELISVLAILLVLLTALPTLLARRSGTFRLDFERQIGDLRGLLPQSPGDRAWFTVAGVCAGVCEEMLYRGFLLYYLHVFPWHLDMATSIAAACLVYGIAHLYQGWSGVLQNVLMALGLSVLFLSTRSLLLPIALHVLISFRIFLVMPQGVARPDRERFRHL